MTDSVASPNPYELARQAAEELASFTGIANYELALTLGSGWARAAEQLGTVVADVPAHEIVGFRASAVEGHTGMLRSVRLENGKHVLVLAGRTHLYEGHGVAPVVHGVRTAAAAGASVMLLTNGAGGIGAGLGVGVGVELGVGKPMFIRDHINLTATSPLVGANFVDLTDLYSAELRAEAQSALAQVGGGDTIPEGVYAQLPGPHYETPAEIQYLRAIGADAVGMSTALEAIAAREAGMRVLGISLITNMAAGLAGPLDHAEVLAAGNDALDELAGLLATIVHRILA